MSANMNQPPVLKVTVTGGGPVGLTFALLLESLMGNQVAIKIYDGRWTKQDSVVVWKNEQQRNSRRLQVVTLQSRQYLKYPQEIQDRLFEEDFYSEMWPMGSDSIQGYGPRNIRIAHIENKLLEIANEKSENIQLIPEFFRIQEKHDEIVDQHLLVICEGGQSRTREYFIDKFGNPDKTMYSLDGNHLQDVVLGLRVKSELPDPMAVLLTVAQNRYLLNSLRGEGFLNMRLTDEEVKEVVGIDLENKELKVCIQSQPCLMELKEGSEHFSCATHGSLFLPALLKISPLWLRIQDGLKLFGVPPEQLTAVTAFRLDMVQRPRFTAQLYPRTPKTPGTFGCLLGDTANAIHFWPGRGLNSGIPSAVSLVRCLKEKWRGRPFREADFTRHEGLMSMLQYRHKSRGWQAMIEVDSDGNVQAIKDVIKNSIENNQIFDKESDLETLMQRLREIRSRLESRLSPLPDDETLRNHLSALEPSTLRTLVLSNPWNTETVGGEEVDVNFLFEEKEPAKAEPAKAEPAKAEPAKAEPAKAEPAKVEPAKVKPQIIASLIYEKGGTGEYKLPAKLDLIEETKQVAIGRKSGDSNFFIPDLTVSRSHAMITVEGQKLIIEDQGSAGGTYINKQKLEPSDKRELQDGDRIIFGGSVTYKVEILKKA